MITHEAFAILAITLGSVSTLHYPTNQSCICGVPTRQGITINCTTKNDSSFIVDIMRGYSMAYSTAYSIKIECINSPEWSDFHLDLSSLPRFCINSPEWSYTQLNLMTESSLPTIEVMIIYKCDLPTNNSLGKITQTLGITGVRGLFFKSYKNLSFALVKRHLDDFENLKSLSLANNNLHQVTGFFNYTPELVWLELDDNALQSIEPGTFDNLKNLWFLDLSGNHLTEPRSGIFDELVALEWLYLNTNSMVKLPEDIFTKLKNLEKLKLFRNNFTHLPRNLLRNNMKLRIFTLFENKQNMTTLPDAFFANLTKLEVLRLKRNGFVTLPEDLFWGCTSLIDINLERNYLRTLPRYIFRDLKELEILKLNFNDLQSLPDYIFLNTEGLVILDLSKNRITSISNDLFSGLHALEKLYIQENQLMTISIHGLNYLENLEIANFSYNNLTLQKDSIIDKSHIIDKFLSPFRHCTSLQKLYLANNSISEIFDDWITRHIRLRKLDLKYNNISSIQTTDMQFVSSNIKVDLTHNKIKNIYLRDADFPEIDTQSSHATILVDDNPLECDCRLYDFLRYIEGRMDPKFQHYFHIIPGNLTCQSPNEFKNVRITDLNSKTFTCVLKEPKVCPEKCDCFVRPEDTAFIFDCSHKNLTSVPSDIKKPVDGSFQFDLNFSGNRLTRMPDLKAMGFESVRKLILSHNAISEIPLDRLSNTIQVLELHNNNLSRIHPDVLEFLKQSTNLTRLTLHENPWKCDCEANDFRSFIQTKFVTMTDLLKVTCPGRNISVSKMTMVDFCSLYTKAIIDKVCPEKCDCFLRPEDRGFIFDCSHKNLTSVPSDIKVTGFFNNTPGLQLLELSDNALQSIEPGTFDNLKNLLILNLSVNHLTKLPENIFAKLENLEVLNLSRNNFTNLPKNLLQNNTKLRNFTLFDNKRNMTTLPDAFFANLTKLEMLKLKRNGFVTLPEDLFWRCTSLININLEQNYLRTLPRYIFRGLQGLKILKLNSNDLGNLPDYIFSNTGHLEKLDLSKNRITSISDYLFNGLYALEELNIQENQLMTISNFGFIYLKQLKIANFSYNNLTLQKDNYIHKYSSHFHYCISLEELYLANNSISEIFNDWIAEYIRLRILDLKYNNISSIQTTDMQFVSSNIKVDLTHNKIKHIYLPDFTKIDTQSSHATILVDDNPLECDCQLYDFLRYIEGRMQPNFQHYLHIILENLTCQSPNELKNVRVTDLNSTTFTCVRKEPKVCPEKCDCFVRPEDRAFIFNCSHKDLTSVPSDIKKPVDGSFQFDLNFSGNRLTRMPDLKAMGFESVRKLILSHNAISEIPLDRLSNTIQVLELHNNNMSRIHPKVLEFLKQSTNLTRLTLHENPWECDCKAIDDLRSFIKTKFVTMTDLLKVTCPGRNISVSVMTMVDFCPSYTTTIMVICIVISLAGFLIGIFGLLYYKYQQQIKVWLFAHQWCLWFVTEEDLDKEKLYDAFVSYSHKDHDFVVDELVPKLENGPTPFKLCLHYRDFLLGEWIPANIASSVENSRRTIVVLSPNFLESVWGRMEFRAAHSQALSEGRARVILILYGDIGHTDDLDSELKAYLDMNTYVQWGDPWFWDKLRYALPHQPKPARNSIAGKKIFENHQLCERGKEGAHLSDWAS